MDSFNFEKELFGGKIQVTVYNPPSNAKEILEGMYREALRLQKIFNFFDPESELSKLNEKRNLKVSIDLLKVIKKSIRFARLTKGKYDPTLGKQILQRKRQEKEEPLNCSYRDIKTRFNRVILRNPEAAIDLGSIAKGYITDRLSEFIRSRGISEFIINSRGDILFSGKAEHIIGIQDPRNRKNKIMKIRLNNESVATSGDYRQFYGSFEKSHILNSSEVISVTVVSKRLEDADVMATALFVSDGKVRAALAERFPNSRIMVIKNSLKAESYNNFAELITK